MARIVKRAYKCRFYPTPEQAEELARTFGCVRLVYNKALEERTRAYTLDGRKVSYVQSSARDHNAAVNILAAGPAER